MLSADEPRDTPLTAPDPDAGARADLARHKALATLALLAMAALTAATWFLPRGTWTDMLQAAARAGVIGGIADWFAVTALFRHPLGLPIPHTAIIPRQKARLGAALGRFVATQVFTEDDVARLLARIDAAGALRRLLADPTTSLPVASAIAGALPRLLATVQSGRARRLIGRMLPRLLGGAATGVVVARALRSLVAGGRHQEVFGFILEQLRVGMAAQEETLRHVVEDRVREQGGRLVGWAIGASVARRVLTAVNAEFEKMEPGDSALRTAFDEWTRREIDRIETDPARAAELGQAIGRVVTHDTILAWLWDVWARIQAALLRDAENPEGRTLAVVQGLLADLGATLSEDPALRARLDAALAEIASRSLPGLRLQLAEFIGRVVEGWDTDTITDRLELRVGRDLQYVRLNGTIVGFLVGGLLQAILGAIR